MFERKFWALLKIIFINILTVMIPSFITLVYTIPALKTFVKTIALNFGCHDFIKAIQIPFTIFILVLVPFLVTIVRFISQQKQKTDSEKLLTSLLAHIDTVISVKTTRFYKYISQHNQETLNSKEVFDKITQPVLQMTEIIKNITSCFEKIYDENTIKTSLLKVNKNGHIGYFIYLDGEPKTEESILNASDSTAKYCYNTKKITIIENTEKKDAKFKHSARFKSETKSIICYPVKQGAKIVFIICITSKTPCIFKKSEKLKTEYLLSQFSKRLVLELYLYQLKERLNG